MLPYSRYHILTECPEAERELCFINTCFFRMGGGPSGNPGAGTPSHLPDDLDFKPISTTSITSKGISYVLSLLKSLLPWLEPSLASSDTKEREGS